jgi:hypothetical protein
MPPKKTRRTDHDFRRIVQRAVNEKMAAHERKQRHRDWLGSTVGFALIVAGVAVFILTNHAKGAEWVALALIILGAGLFDRKTVTGLVKARFGNGDTSEFPTP